MHQAVAGGQPGKSSTLYHPPEYPGLSRTPLSLKNVDSALVPDQNPSQTLSPLLLSSDSRLCFGHSSPSSLFNSKHICTYRNLYSSSTSKIQVCLT